MKDSDTKQVLSFANLNDSNWRFLLPSILKKIKSNSIILDCEEITINCKDFIHINKLCNQSGLRLSLIQASRAETIITASSLGFQTHLYPQSESRKPTSLTEANSFTKSLNPIFFHHGTLRSGELLEKEEDILVVGDVNPGAKVSTGGNVMIWGRLRGIAHAGKNGNSKAKITALELRPVQLRIAEAIARGPNERPEQGLAEEATIENGAIVIKPATTN